MSPVHLGEVMVSIKFATAQAEQAIIRAGRSFDRLRRSFDRLRRSFRRSSRRLRRLERQRARAAGRPIPYDGRYSRPDDLLRECRRINRGNRRRQQRSHHR